MRWDRSDFAPASLLQTTSFFKPDYEIARAEIERADSLSLNFERRGCSN